MKSLQIRQLCSQRIFRLYSLSISTGFWIPPRHVVLKGNCPVPHICFNSSSAGVRGAKSNVLARNDSSPPAFRQFTITSSTPDLVKYEDVLSQISEVNKSRPSSFVESPVIIVLTTPSFATWLEDDTFIARALGANFSSSLASGPYLSVSALFAVVDSLPLVLKEVFHSTEGFAIMSAEQEDCLPGLWQNVDNEGLTGQHQFPSPSLLFKTHRSLVVKNVGIPQTIRIPLANTVFHNGRVSTLLISSWQRSAVSMPFRKVQQIEKTSQEIRPPLLVSSPRMKFPLTYLTPLRRIDSGLGNIVRKVIGENGKPVPASQELETSVDAYLKRDPNKQTLAVWALVIPKSDRGEESDNELNSESIELETSPRNGGSSRISGPSHLSLDDYIGHWLRNGASLHRVLSGGGGWGLKQGLISLDPESGSPKADFDSSGPFGGDQAKALGSIANPGSRIQFLAHRSPTHGGQPEPRPQPALQGSLVLGCVPSISDHMPRSASTASADNDAACGPVTRCFDGYLGAASEKGIYIYSGREGEGPGDLDRAVPLTNSKIDVPYTTLWWAGGNPASSQNHTTGQSKRGDGKVESKI